MSNWQEMALAHGWIEANENGELCLAHEELDRIWPLGDWEGACRDIGLDEEDLAEFAVIGRLEEAE